MLINLQKNFIDEIYRFENKAQLKNKKNQQFLSEIKEGKIDKNQLVEIYQNNLKANLTNALKLTFEKTYQLLGKEIFAKLALDFIKKNRSFSNNLDDYGENFSNFLAKNHSQLISEIANLDWLKHQSYNAINEDFNLEILQKIAADATDDLFELKFKIVESCFFISSDFNLLAKKNVKKPLKDKLKNKPKNKKYFLVYRSFAGVFGNGIFEVKTEKLSKKEFIFLTAIENNLTLFEIFNQQKINIGELLNKFLFKKILIPRC